MAQGIKSPPQNDTKSFPGKVFMTEGSNFNNKLIQRWKYMYIKYMQESLFFIETHWVGQERVESGV